MPTFESDEIAAMLAAAGALPADVDISAIYPVERDEAIRDLYANPAELGSHAAPWYDSAAGRVRLDNLTQEGERKP